MIQLPLTDAQALGGALQELVIRQELQALLQRQNSGRGQADGIVGAGGPHIGQLFALADVDGHILVAAANAHHHAGIHRGTGADEQGAPLLGGAQTVGHGTPVYAGMVVGICSRNEDMTVNVCKRKQLTNMRASGSDDAIRLVTPRIMSLEQCLEFLADDELLECTPKSLRIRKRELDHSTRMRELMKRRAQE